MKEVEIPKKIWAVLDPVLIRSTEAYFQAGPGYGFKTARARIWAHKFMTCWLKEEPARFSEYATRMLEGFEFEIKGTEHIEPKAGIYVINHPSDGPMRGAWIYFLLNHIVCQKLGQDSEPRWIHREETELPLLGIDALSVKKTVIGPTAALIRRRIVSKLSKTTGTILFPQKKEDTPKAMVEVVKTLTNGGKVVLCPEGQDAPVLRRGIKAAGAFLRFFTSQGVPVWPVGIWKDGNTLGLNFGSNFSNEILSTVAAQQASDLAMVEIAKFLPEEKRGVYRTLAKSSEAVKVD